MTRRGKTMTFVVALVVIAVVVLGVLAAMGKAPGPVQSLAGKAGIGSPPPPPPTCPLTGEPAPGGKVPQRPALAIKVENLPEARPQYGIGTADIVYEELVEGSITRFMAIWQCHDASRVEPVRSVRTTDPKLLVQYGHPVFGYAGGAPPIVNKVKATGVIDDVNMLNDPSLYLRDPNRVEPHNLYTSTKSLWHAAKGHLGPPPAVFTYSGTPPSGGKTTHDLHLDFSPYSDVHWIWNQGKDAWLRYYGTQPADTTAGQISAKNVVVQVVKITYGNMSDVLGSKSPIVALQGSGPAFVCRDGKCIKGKWERANLTKTTQFVTKGGQQIPLAPGNTWVELYPSSAPKVKPH